MAEPWGVVVVVLSVLSIAVAVMAITLGVIAYEFRRTLRQVAAILPGCDRAAHEVQRTLGQARRLLTRTDHVARDVETVIQRACGATTQLLDEVVYWKTRAHTFLAERFGNGARPGPRRRFLG